MTRAPSLSMLAVTAAMALLSACRGSLGSVCRCNSDCRAGLVCEAEGLKTLVDDMCYAQGAGGVCVESEVIDSDSGMPVDITEPGTYLDMSSRRDFGGGSVSDSLSGTTSDTGSTTVTTDLTGTGTTTTGDTSTGDTSTGTSTTTTGDTSTGTTTTGDTSTSTGDTDTSTGTSTGTTGTTGTTGDSSSSSTG